MNYSVKVKVPQEGFAKSSSSLYNNNNTLHTSILSRNFYGNDDSTDQSIRSLDDMKESYTPSSNSDHPSTLSLSSNNTKRVTEVAFRHQNRTTDSIQKFITPFTNIKALDVSYNKLTALPRSLPSSLIAIDISYNVMTSLKSFHRINHLIELRISNNNITSTIGLTNIITLEYLDISNNKITVLEGLETLTNLKVLLLNDNSIADEISVRPLSFNTGLEVLSLSNNPITNLKGYKPIILRLLPQLYRLDDYQLSRKNDKGSYKKMFEDKEKNGYQLNNTNSTTAGVVDMRYRGYNDSMIQKYDDKSSIFVYDGSADGSVGPPKTAAAPGSAIPWRNPPNPLPRPWKGKALFESVPYTEQLVLKMEKVRKTPKSQDTTQWMTPSLATKSKILLDTETVLGHPSDPSERKSPTKLMTDNSYMYDRDYDADYNPQSSIRSKQLNDSDDRIKKPTVPPFVVTSSSSKHVISKMASQDEASINSAQKSDDMPWHLDTKSAQLRAAFVRGQLERDNEISQIELSKTVVPTSLSYISNSRKGYNDISDSSISLDLVSEAISVSQQVNASVGDKGQSIRKESPYAMLINLQKKLGYSTDNISNATHHNLNISPPPPPPPIEATPKPTIFEKLNSPVLSSSPVTSDMNFLEGKQLAEAIKDLMERKQNTIEILQSARKKTSALTI